MKKSIVLLSSGLDSLVNFKMAFDETLVKLIITFDYGQASAKKEIEASSLVAKKYDIEHKIIKLDFLDKISNALKKDNIIDFDENRFNDNDYTKQTAKLVWVPNRNGLFLNIAASFAEVYEIDYIVVGFNKEEAETFPDNSKKFIKRANKAFKYSTLYRPKVFCYTIDMMKNEIVKYGIDVDAPFEYLWSCYRNNEKMCGVCESCQRLKRALKSNNFYEEFLKINKWGFEK
ncbi:MAG: 7-cyano-7-deazaguanine synthase QueC [Brevinematales bacterium]|nr:7-cyano-7-deazaguanine synthase QueC [Brevinematales bacterium]